MKIIIIDDEENIRSGLKKMLKMFCRDIIVLAEAKDVKSGLKAIYSYQPDLVLLDIEMPDGSGFDLLKTIGRPSFQTIFVTAYDQYAVDAFRMSAIDYLLKPIQPSHLVEAIEKARKMIGSRLPTLAYSILMDNMNLHSNQEQKIVLKDSEGLSIVGIGDILRCEADGSYTRFYLVSGQNILTSSNLKEYEKLFEKFGFLRTHHSHLVNLQHVVRFNKNQGGELVLSDQSTVPVSFRKKEALIQSLNQLFRKF